LIQYLMMQKTSLKELPLLKLAVYGVIYIQIVNTL